MLTPGLGFPPPAIDGDRLWRSLEAMGEIGALPGGGSCRLACSDDDAAGRDLFAGWCREAACELRIDDWGNMFALRAGRDTSLAPVFIGSHLDTQPTGGRFDGVFGVLAGLEVVRALNDAACATDRPLAIVNWTNEEGVRFSPGLTGSKGYAGLIGAAERAALATADGAPFEAELARIGYLGAPYIVRPAAYLEAHIEQGPVLEDTGAPVGVVTGVQGVRWFDAEFLGAARHAGTTPMHLRRDAFMAASRFALAAREAVAALAADARLTFGRAAVSPGAVNTVAERAVLSVDLRHPDSKLLDAAEKALAEQAGKAAAAEGCTADVRRTFDLPPTRFDPGLVECIAEATRACGLATVRLTSGAMHDACPLAAVAPTAMIFAASREGISHSPAEWSEPADLAAACQVLMNVVVAASRAATAS